MNVKSAIAFSFLSLMVGFPVRPGGQRSRVPARTFSKQCERISKSGSL